MYNQENFDKSFDIAMELYEKGEMYTDDHNTEVIYCMCTIIMGGLLKVLKVRNKCSDEQLRILGSNFLTSANFCYAGYTKTGNENFLIYGIRTFQDQAEFIHNTYDLSAETANA